MRYQVFLKIAHTSCLLETSRIDWKIFLEKKYSRFTTSVEKADYKIRLCFIDKGDREARFVDSKTAEVYVYDNKRTFKNNFNFVFKFVLGKFLLDHNAFLLHSTAIHHNNAVYFFSGSDGAGKSTVGKLLSDKTKLADDRSIIVLENGSFNFYSAPFYEKNKFEFFDGPSPVKAIFFLKKADHEALVLLGKEEAFVEVLKNTMVQRGLADSNANSFIGLMETLKKFTERVNCYHLYFRKNNLFWNLIKDL